MAKTVNKASRVFNVFNKEERAYEKKNLFDLSHDVKTTFQMGKLIPFLCQETLPGDEFTISTETLLRFAPLQLPIMHRVELRMNYYYVPNRIIFDKWEKFIVGEEIEWPYMSINFSISTNDLFQYMGAASPGFTGQNVSILPLGAYYRIYDEYYRNPHIQNEKFIPLIEGDNSSNYVSLTVPVNVNWNLDYYTAQKPMPQAGQDVLIPSAEIRSGLTNMPFPTFYNSNTGATPSANSQLQTDASAPRAIRTAATNTPLTMDLQPLMGTIREFRLAAAIQSWLEKLNRTSVRYRDFLKGFFNSDPDPGKIDLPVWIGGTVGTVVISEVLSTAETEQVVGGYAGQALAFKNTKNFKYRCREHGFILGLIDIRPRTSYFQGLDRKFMRETYLDYAFPQFAEIGDQEVKNVEVHAMHNNPDDVFGYIPRYSEYRWSNDIISGQMRTTFLNFHLGRALTQTVALNDEFVTCVPRSEDVFVLVEGEDEVYAHMFNNVKVRRMLPRFGIPKI